MKNRRNFYRVLHVQPEAPLEIIKASYRSLMTKLKAHPDLGGDHDAAVMINQAYAVLGNPEKRRQYDETLRARKGVATARPTPADRPPPPPRANAYARPRPDARSHARPGAYGGSRAQAAAAEIYSVCPFCREEAPSPRRPQARCTACASPLALALAAPGVHMRELFGRRTAPRISKAAEIRLYPSWPHTGFPAQLRDVSSTGISLLAHYRPQAAQILKLDGRLLSGIARVVSVRGGAQGAVSIHAAFLTAELLAKAGAFVSEQA